MLNALYFLLEGFFALVIISFMAWALASIGNKVSDFHRAGMERVRRGEAGRK